MINTTENLPAPLLEIFESLERAQKTPSNIEELRTEWEIYLDQVRTQLPECHIESNGEVLYLGNMSPGCRACKAGSWDCIFLTMRCNLQCGFCYSPQAIPVDYAGSVFGTTPQQIASNHARTHITGIGLSGGEPFMQPIKLLEWVAWFREHSPEKYCWVYTNGLLADERVLQQLGQLGLDEIRFNTAASGYTHPVVMNNLAQAAQFIPNVTVEIPAVPEHAPKLLSSVKQWCDRGVKFLNLHELMYEPNTISATMEGRRRTVILKDGHRFEINPESRYLTLAVMKKIQDENLPMGVNDCSLQSKLRQLRGRRRNLAPLTQTSYEQLIEGEILESFCFYQDDQKYFFCHSDSVLDMRARYPAYKIARIWREAPLFLSGKKRWIACENY